MIAALPASQPQPPPNIKAIEDQIAALSRQVALSQRINNITGSSASPLTISSPTISGATISGSGTNVSGTLSGSFSGSIANSSADLTTLIVDTSTLTTDATNNRVGIGTTSPYTTLSVVGEVAAQKFTATSTTATSTFSGALNLASTTATGAGTILVNGTRFLHDYGTRNLFLGSGAGNLTMTGTGQNIGIGEGTLMNTTSGYRNTAVGYQSLLNTTSGYRNTAVGYQSLLSNTTGSYNTASGYRSLYSNTTGIRNTTSGYNAGRVITTGSANTFLGYNAGNTGTTATVASSTAIGYEAQVATSSSIILGGTGVFNTWVGTGTTSPSAKFSIGQPANTSQGGVWLAATDGDFRAFYMDTSGVFNFYGGDGGTLNTATLNAAGAWTNASDLAYKENLATLDYGLETLRLLTPRSYTMKGSGLKQIGFVAQELELLVPEVVSGEEGSKGISYGNLVSVVVKAVQDLDLKVIALASTAMANVNTGASALSATVTEWVGEKITVTIGYFKNLFADRVTTKELCIDDLCISRDQFKTLLDQANVTSSPSANQPQATSSAPVITLNGNSPAEIEVGSVYSDLGVIARDSEGRDLSVRNFVNGVQVEQISLDTSASTTYTIDYAATDNNGLTATSTRTVIVGNRQQEDEEIPTAENLPQVENATTTTTTTENI